MNRRDTIIIAVLLNAGVLAILFMLAVNERDDELPYAPALPPVVRAEQQTNEPRQIALAKPSQEEFTEFNLDEAAAGNEETVPLDNYTFVSETEIVEPAKPVPAPMPTVPGDAYVEVTVKRGDSLDKLARSNGTTIEAIKKANNLKSDMLSVGQVLRIPTTGAKPAVVQKVQELKKSTPEPGGAVYYTMKTGDSPWKVARQNNMNVDELLKLNNLDEDKARSLKVGDKIRIR